MVLRFLIVFKQIC